MIRPSREEFRELARNRRIISVYDKIFADDLTPVALYAALAKNQPGTFLLESAAAGVWSRYSFVGVSAAATLTEQDGQAIWRGRELVGVPSGNPLEVLQLTLEALATPRHHGLPPFQAGMVGYLGYDVVRRLEVLPDTCTDELKLPELVMMLTSQLAVLDHHNSEVWLISNAINFDDSPERVDQAWQEACAGVTAMAQQLSQPRQALSLQIGEPAPIKVRRQRSAEQYQQMVRAAQEEIKAGEAFQVVVSQRFDIGFTVDAFDLYRALRQTNPSPFLYLMRLDGFDVVGSSPEALVTVQGRTATTRPIAGSRRRGATEAEDAALAAELKADPKEAAEHVMLVDLGRNDLGRICEPGTVTVHEFMNIHRYSHVMHMEAAVSGTLRDGVSALDATLACFPAGTLSGAPKVRAMAIIDELEATRRGLYGGVVGYFDFAGDSDVAIAIRTAVIKDGIAYVQAGAGIVADSNPEHEDAECHSKAAALMSAIARASGAAQ